MGKINRKENEMSYNSDQYTEPQQGLEPERSLNELYDLFLAQTRAKYSAFSVSRCAILLWEEFKKKHGLPALTR